MIRILRHHLQSALKGLAKVVSAKAALPILRHIRITARAGRVTISATDLDQHLEYRITDAEIGGDMDLAVPYAGLREFAGSGDGRASVAIGPGKDGRAVVSFLAGGHLVERTLDTMDIGDWPGSNAQEAELLPVNADIFEAMRLSIPSASKDDSRRVLRGVCLESDGIVATDGKHLVHLDCVLPVTEPAIVPATKFLASGILDQDGGLAVVQKGDFSYALFECGPWHYSVKCLDGSYPNYRHIVPDKKTLAAKVRFTDGDVAALLRSLPVFEKVDDLNSVALYAGKLGVKILSTDLKSPAKLDTASACEGKEEHYVKVFNRSYLLRAFDLGFRDIAFNSGYSVILATGAKGLLVFMPINSRNDKEHLAKLGIVQSQQEEKTMTQKIETAPVAAQQPEQKQKEQTTSQKQDAGATIRPFQPAANAPGSNGNGGIAADPFEDLAKSINDARSYTKGLADMLGSLHRKVYEAQKAVKQRERDFRSTREILDKLKNASGF